MSDCGSAYAFISHAGLFLVLSGGFFGAPDRTDARMTVFENGSAERLAYGHDGNLVCLPFSVALEDFSIDCYDDGTSPKQYTSLLSCDGNILKTSVNHPCRYKGYSIFQSGYDIVRRQFPPIVKSEPSYVLSGEYCPSLTTCLLSVV